MHGVSINIVTPVLRRSGNDRARSRHVLLALLLVSGVLILSGITCE
jgi:hypothetical protein